MKGGEAETRCVKGGEAETRCVKGGEAEKEPSRASVHGCCVKRERYRKRQRYHVKSEYKSEIEKQKSQRA